MATQTVEFLSCKDICCGDLPADIFICLPSDLVAAGVGSIAAVLFSKRSVTGGCYKKYAYTIQVDDSLLVEGTVLSGSEITGILCSDCLTQFIQDQGALGASCTNEIFGFGTDGDLVVEEDIQLLQPYDSGSPVGAGRAYYFENVTIPEGLTLLSYAVIKPGGEGTDVYEYMPLYVSDTLTINGTLSAQIYPAQDPPPSSPTNDGNTFFGDGGGTRGYLNPFVNDGSGGGSCVGGTSGGGGDDGSSPTNGTVGDIYPDNTILFSRGYDTGMYGGGIGGSGGDGGPTGGGGGGTGGSYGTNQSDLAYFWSPGRLMPHGLVDFVGQVFAFSASDYTYRMKVIGGGTAGGGGGGGLYFPTGGALGGNGGIGGVGGNGGGTVAIYAKNIVFGTNGKITANGQDGQDGGDGVSGDPSDEPSGGGGGGGGGGGLIYIVTESITLPNGASLSDVLEITGGNAGSGGAAGVGGAGGSAGADGADGAPGKAYIIDITNCTCEVLTGES